MFLEQQWLINTKRVICHLLLNILAMPQDIIMPESLLYVGKHD